MADMKRWKVTINRWEVLVVRNVEAASGEEAEEIALESWANDHGWEHEDGGLNSIEAEVEEE